VLARTELAIDTKADFQDEGNLKPVHEALTIQELHRLFEDHGMELLGPPLAGIWTLHEDGSAVLKS